MVFHLLHERSGLNYICAHVLIAWGFNMDIVHWNLLLSSKIYIIKEKSQKGQLFFTSIDSAHACIFCFVLTLKTFQAIENISLLRTLLIFFFHLTVFTSHRAPGTHLKRKYHNL